MPKMTVKSASGVGGQSRVLLEPVFPGDLRQMEFSSRPDEAGWSFARAAGRKQEFLKHLTVIQVTQTGYGLMEKPSGERHIGGVETFLETINEHLALSYPMSIHVVCSTLNPKEKPYTVRKEGWKGEVIVHPTYKFGANFVKDCRQIVRLMNESDADVVHLHSPSNLSSLGVALAVNALDCGFSLTYHGQPGKLSWGINPVRALRRVREVFGEHWKADGWASLGDFFMDLTSKGVGKLIPGQGLRLPVYKLAERSSRTPFVSYSLCGVSEDSVREFGSLGGLVVGNPMDTGFFSPESVDSDRCERLKRGYGLEGKKVLICHGRICTGKNQHFLVECARDIQARLGDDMRVVLIGPVSDEKYHREVSELIRANRLEDRVLLLQTATQEEIRDWLSIADVMVFPSLSEGLGRSGIEALSMETPVVAFRTGGIPDYITDGETGYLVEQGDKQAFVDSVCKVFADPEKAAQMAANGRRLVERKYSLDKVCKDYMELVFAPAAVARRMR